MNGGNRTKTLVRDRKGRMLAGVCAGAAQYFGLDVTLVRVIVAVVSVITGGAGVLAYLVQWVLASGSRDSFHTRHSNCSKDFLYVERTSRLGLTSADVLRLSGRPQVRRALPTLSGCSRSGSGAGPGGAGRSG
jgi:phage shock protein PspC (stress-responsive transcriptional regulator)